MSEKFCLKWNDYQSNICYTYANLRSDDDFFDVTLVSDDQKIFKAHKLVLSSCSDYFKNILKAKKHSDPMLCLFGVNSMELSHILDYIYQGEVKLYQEDLDIFLDKAQQLQIKGLLQGQDEKDKVDQQKNLATPKPIEESYSSNKINPTKIEENIEQTKMLAPILSNAPIDEVEERISSIMSKNENGEYICTICGKNSKKHIQNMRNHIETHLEGISFTCDVCMKQFRSRNSLKSHCSQRH